MPPKRTGSASPTSARKASAGKKKKAGDGRVQSASSRDVMPALPIDRLQWVRLNLRLVTWEHGNFSITVPALFTIGAVVKAIEERFEGTVAGIEVFRERLGDDNKLDENRTLEDHGLAGGPQNDPPQYTLVYDFPPNHTECPLLNVDGQMFIGSAASATQAPPSGLGVDKRRSFIARAMSNVSPHDAHAAKGDKTPLF